MTISELRDKFWDMRHEADKLQNNIEADSYFWQKLDEIKDICTDAMSELDWLEVKT